MIVHLGNNSDEGHFILYCRNNNKDKSFYKYNNSSVKNIDFEEKKIKSPLYFILSKDI